LKGRRRTAPVPGSRAFFARLAPGSRGTGRPPSAPRFPGSEPAGGRAGRWGSPVEDFGPGL